MNDLKALTEDVLYETYRTEKLSRSVETGPGGVRDSVIHPEELATQSVRIKEEQLRREEEKVITLDLYRISDINSLLYPASGG